MKYRLAWCSAALLVALVAVGCTAPGGADETRSAVVRLENTAGGQGMVLDVVLRGTATTWAVNAPTVDFGEGVAARSVAVEGDTYAIATVEIAVDAPLGRRDVDVRWGAGEDAMAYVVDDGFVVQTGGISLDPAYGRLGETVEVAITGFNTSFQDGYTQATFGEEIYVDRVAVESEDRATATISISPTASPGLRDVTVFNGSTAWTAPGAFQVDRAALTVTFEPTEGRQGQTLDFTLYGTNTTFTEGLTTVDLGPDIDVQLVDVIDSVNAFGRMKISNAAELGLRDVVVGTGDEVLTVHDGFEVLETPADIDLVQVALGLSVDRGIDNDTCQIGEAVSAYVIFYQPLDVSCGPPPIMAFPYDINYDFDVSTDYVDCPTPQTFDAGEEVYLVSLDNTLTLTLIRYRDSFSGFTAYYPDPDLTLAEHPFDTPFRLEVPGSADPDGVPAFTSDDCIDAESGEPLERGVVFTTIPKDFSILAPELCHDYSHAPTDPLQVEWTIAETYDVAGMSIVLQTSDVSGQGRFLLVLPWDDGYWQWDPGMLGLIPEGSGTLAIGVGRADIPEFYLPFGSGGKNQASSGVGIAGSITLRAE